MGDVLFIMIAIIIFSNQYAMVMSLYKIDQFIIFFHGWSTQQAKSNERLKSKFKGGPIWTHNAHAETWQALVLSYLSEF